MRHREYRGKTALVYYRGGAAGEEIVEDHSPAVQSEPERILLGSGEVPLGVSDVLYDMEVGEERRAVIPCDRAFGRHDPEGVQRYARMLVPGGDRLEAGVVFAWRHPVTGASVPVKCVEATKDAVVVDFNHLLAGKDLEDWFKLVDVVDDAGVSVTGWQAMCYPCTFCGACGKFESDLFVLSQPPVTTCLACKTVFEASLRRCPACGTGLPVPGEKRKDNVRRLSCASDLQQ